MKRTKALSMGNAPFAFAKRTSASLMWGASAALLPALAWGLYCFGLQALVVIAASVLGALVGEAVASGLRKRFTLLDGSAFLTGLLVGMAMPPGVAPFIPALASLFAVSVVKGAFGGLGANWMNPALAGIAFALLNWPEEMAAWSVPRHLENLAGVSGATPLGYCRAHLAAASTGTGPMDILTMSGIKFTYTDSSITDFLNQGLFSRLGADLPGGYIDLLIGNKQGALGELSAILILAASIILLSRKMIRWEIPASIIGSFALLTWTFGGLPYGRDFFSGDILFSVLSGSFLLVAFFMAPDPVTSPSSRSGMLIYGVGVGVITFVLRSFGASAEGSAFAVILMNCVVPAIAKIDSATSLRRAAKAAAEAAGTGEQS
jgi:Na+-translocating ferredoxin:NAD+ oxidoreductase subunit D